MLIDRGVWGSWIITTCSLIGLSKVGSKGDAKGMRAIMLGAMVGAMVGQLMTTRESLIELRYAGAPVVSRIALAYSDESLGKQKEDEFEEFGFDF